MGNTCEKCIKRRNKSLLDAPCQDLTSNERYKVFHMYNDICAKTKDHDKANRLISETHMCNPKKSLIWIYEKVLRDLN